MPEPINVTDERDLTSALKNLGHAMQAVRRMEKRRGDPPRFGSDPHWVLREAGYAVSNASNLLLDYIEDADPRDKGWSSHVIANVEVEDG